MRELLLKGAVYLVLLLVWAALWSFTIYWTVRLIHRAWLAGP
jgi:hypothetical protein